MMEKRTKRIQIRLSEEEHLELLRLKTKPRLAEWIRETVFVNEKTKSKATPKFSGKKVDERFLYELNKLGNNLNQIAYGINTAHLDGSKVELVRVLSELEQINLGLEALLRKVSDVS